MTEPRAGEAEGWPSRGFEPELAALVPGHLQRDLAREGLEPDHNFAENARIFEAREGKDWWLSREFELGELSEHMELYFGGLDTDADVWLNGTHLGHHSNAHVSWTIDVTSAIRSGPNRLVVRLDDGTRGAGEKELERYLGLADPVTSYNDPRMWVRKPQYVWRWDWCPRLITCGIWRSVELRGYDSVVLRDVQMRTAFAEDGSATVEADCEIERFGQAADATIDLELTGPSGSHVGSALVESGVDRVKVPVTVTEPDRWWPAPLGEPTLYDCRINVTTPLGCDERSFRFGLRTIELERRDLGPEGESFTFVVNGVPLFCKGSGWQPPELLFGCVEEPKLRHLIDLAAEANMNMLRVNGCGTYESDLFYELCDEKGILVWQDFPFTCAHFPDDDEGFREAVREEAELAVRRLRNHASLALWCGGNEVEWLFAFDAAAHEKSATGAAPRLYGERIYREILPEVCARLDSERSYLPNTPWGSGFPNDDSAGTRHVWEYQDRSEQDRVHVSDIQLDRSKFVSEFGFLGPSELSSLQRFIPAEELTLKSPSWSFHNNAIEEGITSAVIERLWASPETLGFEDYLALGQLFQAEALAGAVRHWRRRMPMTSGAISWGYLDCWGTSTSWSLIDYYERPRAAYFHMRRAFEPVQVSLARHGDRFHAWIVSDLLDSHEATLELGFVDLVESKRMGRTERVAVAGGSAAIVAELNPDYTVRAYPERFLAYAQLSINGRVLSSARETFVGLEFKRLQLPTPQVTVVQNEKAVEITADTYALQFHMTSPGKTHLRDNWFDLLPGESRTMALLDTDDQALTFRSIFGAGNDGASVMLAEI